MLLDVLLDSAGSVLRQLGEPPTQHRRAAPEQAETILMGRLRLEALSEGRQLIQSLFAQVFVLHMQCPSFLE
jgi:hypothetical protein